MAKILYVKAWGLWSHFESVFDFSPGLTVITGPNGSGKSTLIRIIKWVAQGEPSGESFIFKVEDGAGNVIRQADEGKAEIGLDDGVVITKTRKKGKTTYTINTIAEPFEKAEVPTEIKDALGINKYTFGDFESYLNYAFQLEAPFLISESPSVGAKVLGKLAGTEAVDLAIREIAKRTHKAREEKRLADKEIERINGDLLDYQDLEDLKEKIAACEYLVGEIDEAVTKHKNLEELDHKVTQALDDIGTLEEQLQNFMILPDLEEDLQNVVKAQLRYDTLLDLYGQLNQSAATISTLSDQLTLYKGVAAANTMTSDLEVTAQRLTTITSLSTLYTSYTQTILTADGFLATVEGIDVAAADLEYAAKDNEKLNSLYKLMGEYFLSNRQVDSIKYDLELLGGTEEAARILEEAAARAQRVASLKQLEGDFHNKNILLHQFINGLKAATASYTDADEELKAAWDASGGICPLCEEPIDGHNH